MHNFPCSLCATWWVVVPLKLPTPIRQIRLLHRTASSRQGWSQNTGQVFVSPPWLWKIRAHDGLFDSRDNSCVQVTSLKASSWPAAGLCQSVWCRSVSFTALLFLICSLQRLVSNYSKVPSVTASRRSSLDANLARAATTCGCEKAQIRWCKSVLCLATHKSESIKEPASLRRLLVQTALTAAFRSDDASFVVSLPPFQLATCFATHNDALFPTFSCCFLKLSAAFLWLRPCTAETSILRENSEPWSSVSSKGVGQAHCNRRRHKKAARAGNLSPDCREGFSCLAPTVVSEQAA